MNRRRALLAGGGYKGLPIYKKGATDWQNVAGVTTSVSPIISFGTSTVTITASSKNTGSKVDLLISEEVYKKFSKLVFKIGSTSSSGKIIWQHNIQPGMPGEKIEVALTSTTATEKYIDISQSSGNRYITLYIYIKNAVFTIYDIHFE